MQTCSCLALIVGVLGREAEQMIYPKGLQLSEVVPERTRLWSATACTWDHVPTFGVVYTGSSRPRVGVNDSPTSQRRQINSFTSAHQMAGGTVINGCGDHRPIWGFYGPHHCKDFS